MAGTCIATAKIVGVTSLGLLTSSLTYQSLQNIPNLINELNTKVSSLSQSNVLVAVRNAITAGRVGFAVLGGLATGLLSLAFLKSPPNAQHPYLLYSALGAPLALAVTYYRGFKLENKLLHKANSVKKISGAEAPKAAAGEPATAKSDDESPLDKSYIHVSDEDSSSNTSTPAATVPNSPKTTTVESLQEELSLEEEIDNVLLKKEIANELDTLKLQYGLGSAVVGVSFLISLVGVIGDLYVM